MSKLYDLLSAMCGKIKKPDWNQNDPTAPDYVKNKPKIATNEDIMDLLSGLEMVNPVTTSDGSILTSATGEIYSL